MTAEPLLAYCLLGPSPKEEEKRNLSKYERRQRQIHQMANRCMHLQYVIDAYDVRV